MTENKDDKIDLAREIEELDSFLEEQEDDFPLEVEDDEPKKPVFSQPPLEKKKQEKRKASSGKYLFYLVFVMFLIGVGYAGVTYGPQMIKGPQFEKVQTYVAGNSDEFFDNISQKVKSYIPSSSDSNTKAENNRQVESDLNTMFANDGNNLPSPSDQDLVAVDDISTLEENIPVANTIGEVLAITQNANDVENETTPEELDIQAEVESILNDLEIVDDNQVPSMPNAEDLEPLNQDVIETASEIKQIEGAELVAIIEDDASLSPEEIVSEANNFEQPVQAIETKKAVPVVEKRQSKPVDVQKSQPKPVKPADPRLELARSNYDEGNYQSALDVYEQILADDPANTGALTGLQLTKAKIRMSGNQVMQPSVATLSQQLVVNTMPSAPVASVTENNSDIVGLLQRAQNEPNNAALAVQIANIYGMQGQKDKALEWYRNALRLDVMFGSAIDRMAVYDSMADLQ